jgi:hypothetical protein
MAKGIGRNGELFRQLCDPGWLIACAREAARGKRRRPDAARFLLDLEPECFRLAEGLAADTWRPGEYRTFRIREPKPRLISAAPFADRVVHHAVVGVMEPHIERRVGAHSYASRVSKGTHRALRRAVHLSRVRRFVLRGDVVKFFPSVDHQVVLGEVQRVIADERAMQVLELVVRGACPQEQVLAWYPGDDLFEPAVRRRGLPIGNLTSQFLANVLLDRLDHAVMDGMGCGDYVRYCDDFLVFGDDAARLWQVQQGIVRVLAGLRLSLHERKGGVHATRGVMPFLGFTIRQGQCRMQRLGVVRATRRLRRSVQAARCGELARPVLLSRLAAWMGHAQHASSPRVVTGVLERAGLPGMFSEAAIRKRLWPCVARRQLEQQLQQLPRFQPQQQHARQPQQQHRVSSREHAAR